jgi:SecD/SecF fusion protein
MSGLVLKGLLLAADAAPAVKKAADSSGGASFLIFLAVVFLVFVLPFLLGSFIARSLNVRDLGTRIGTVLFAVMIGFAPFVWQYVKGAREQSAYTARLAAWEAEGKEKGEPEPTRPEPRTWQSAIKLGIDLEGGTNLVFETDPIAGKEVTPDVLAQLVTAIGRRINPTGTEEVVVRAVGRNRIEVIVPGAKPEEVARIKQLITRLGSLEFAILANRSDHDAIIQRAQGAKKDVFDANGNVIASWREVAFGKDKKPKYTPGQSDISREVDEKGEKITQVLIVLDREPDNRVTGKYLTRAHETVDESGGAAVGFNFNTRGAFLFQKLTSLNGPRSDGSFRNLAVLLDERIHTAPVIRSTISDSGMISGRYTRDEVNELIGVLKAGALEVPLKPDPVSEFSVGPLLAHDVRDKGMMSVYVSSILIFAFMFIYYRFAGLVANICLVLNIVLILASMAYIDATFTLPGIAGIVLTVGMAVDSNVLIFERMREEQERGSSLRMTIQNGFGRALSAIVDGNMVSLITAVILYMIGTDQIRGFAVTLFIGLSVSMFTAVFMGRVIFELVERKRWIKRVSMMSLIKVPHIDWISWWKPAVAISAVFVIAGFIAMGARGVDNLDIDFTGGTVVTFDFEKDQELHKVQELLQKPEAEGGLGSTATVERLMALGATPTEDSSGKDLGKQFRIRTKEQDIKKVADTIYKQMNSNDMKIRQVTVDIGNVVDLASSETKRETLAKFPQGRDVLLTFSGPIKTTTAEDYVAQALSEIKGAAPEKKDVDDPESEPDAEKTKAKANAPKYDVPKALFVVEGVTASDDDRSAGFTTVRLNASTELPEADLKTALASMQHRMATEPVFTEVNTFDSQVAQEMQEMALLAILFSLIAIVGYIWFRFERVTWGFAAVAALFHDVLVTLAAIPLAAYLSQTPVGKALGFEDFKINLGVVASILTIIGYSLNDTIVIFDRIREIRGKNPALTADMLNSSVNQTLSRTMLTAASCFIVVIVMYAVGGEGLHAFAFTMIVGVISGSWSTIYMSNPVLLWLMNRPGSAPARASAPIGSAKPSAAG